jgi:hypothetical protein
MVAGEGMSEALIAYLAQAIHRASTVYGNRPRSDPQHALALGEAVALFNLADEFGLIDAVRHEVDGRAGRDVYRGLSGAMKAYYLGGARGGEPPRSPSGQRPGTPRSARPRRSERP